MPKLLAAWLDALHAYAAAVVARDTTNPLDEPAIEAARRAEREAARQKNEAWLAWNNETWKAEAGDEALHA